jgi:hypothetical protein
MSLADEQAGWKKRDRFWCWMGSFFFGEHTTVDNPPGADRPAPALIVPLVGEGVATEPIL